MHYSIKEIDNEDLPVKRRQVLIVFLGRSRVDLAIDDLVSLWSYGDI